MHLHCSSCVPTEKEQINGVTIALLCSVTYLAELPWYEAM